MEDRFSGDMAQMICMILSQTRGRFCKHHHEIQCETMLSLGLKFGFIHDTVKLL